MSRATINDVARQAAVSKSTVSHVINHTRFVEEATRQRVLQVIDEIGYRPSKLARSLTTNRTETIGVLISDASNHFFGELIRGIEDVLRPANYGILVCNTDEILEREDHYMNLLLRQRVDGIIAAANSQRWDVLSKFDVQSTPVVFVDRSYEGLEGLFVGVDNRRGAYLGTRHLIEAGHRKIGILAGFQRLSTMRERLAGFHQALDEAGIALPDEWVVPSRLGVEPGRQAAHQILSLPDRPTALFVSNNFLSLGTLLAIKEMGLRCPENVALVGFDDHPWALVSDPPLSVVRQPARCLGQVSARMLLDRINGVALLENRVSLDCELVLRQSCCPNHPRTAGQEEHAEALLGR